MSQNRQVETKDSIEIMSNVSNPEVQKKAERRRFNAEYKRSILAEAEGCTDRGELGSLLRREGLYDSHLSRWRKAEREGRLGGKGQKTTTKTNRNKQDKLLNERIVELERENKRLKTELEKAETIMDVQKKLSVLFGIETVT